MFNDDSIAFPIKNNMDASLDVGNFTGRRFTKIDKQPLINAQEASMEEAQEFTSHPFLFLSKNKSFYYCSYYDDLKIGGDSKLYRRSL